MLAIILVILSAVAIVVDGVAIILAYISLIPALIAFGEKTKNLMKVYGILFLVAHIVLGIRIVLDMTAQTDNMSQGLVNFKLFEKCSNLMFSTLEGDQHELTETQKMLFDQCMNANIEIETKQINTR